jgi:YbbR domain-containing protein
MPKKIKTDTLLDILKGWFTKNPSIKGVALLAALIAWAVVAANSNSKAVISVPFKVKYDMSKNLVIEGAIPAEISVTVWGPNDVVRTLGPSQVWLALDIPDPKKGENRFMMNQVRIFLPDKVTLLGIDPSVIKLNFVEQKK